MTALAVSPEECVLAGTADGAMLVFAPDPRRHITRRYNLADAWAGAAKSNTKSDT